jgi:DNA-binding winged helix-turn-helix (wHTH) protein/tetratricopeptide (TPR) repeat protein
MNAREVYEFGEFRLDVPERRLSRGTTSIPLAPKAFDILVVLVRRAGRLISKRELLTLVWPDTFVEMGIVAVHVSGLRQALDDTNRAPRYIETVSRSGYRFTAVVRKIDGASRFASTAARTSLAVLPFKPLIEEMRDAALEMGVADSVITRLGRECAIVVRPLSAVRKFVELDQDPVAAGRELGVNAVVDGTIRRHGDQITVTARLLSVADGSSMWAATFARRLTDIFDVEEAIADQVFEALDLGPSTRHPAWSRKRYTKDTEAYLLYLKGRYLWERRTDGSALKAIEQFEAAIEKDPSYALAYSGLGACYQTLSFTNGFPPRDIFPKSRLALLHALKLDESLPQAHESLAGLKFWYERDWEGAEREFTRAIELDPDQPAAHRFFGHYLSNMGRHERALHETRLALELDPSSTVTHARLGQFLYQSGDHEGALKQLHRALKMDPEYWMTRLNLGRVYERQGRYAEALVELHAACDRAKRSGEARGTLGYTLAVSGRESAARKVFEEMERAQHAGLVYGYYLALIAAGLGDREQVYAQLRSALDDRDPGLTFLLVEPRWAPYSREAAFQEVLNRVGFHTAASEPARP